MAEWNLWCELFGRGHYKEHFGEVIEFGPMVQEEMLLKDISYLQLWWLSCLMEWNSRCNFGRGHYEKDSCETILKFKDFSYLQLRWPYCGVERNHLCNSGRGHYEENFCETNLNLDQWFRRRCHLR